MLSLLLMHRLLWLFLGEIDFFDLPCIFFIFDDFRVGFDLLVLSAMHCCCYKAKIRIKSLSIIEKV